MESTKCARAFHGIDVAIEQAVEEDLAEILELQKTAYRSEGEIYCDPAIPPLTQTLKDMQDDFMHQVFLKAVCEGRIIGSVRAYLKGGTCHIGRLMVLPEFQNRGVGTQLMSRIETVCRRAVRYELFTGHKSERNIRFYRKLGYRVFRTKSTGRRDLVYMEKSGHPSATAPKPAKTLQKRPAGK